LRGKLVDSPDSVAARYRRRRWDMLVAEFPDLAQMSVIDLGGRVEAWRRAPVRPAHVHIVNLEPPDPEIPEWAEVDHADACDLPEPIRSRRYDLAFSNAVLEHVGGHVKRLEFADTVRASADRHWIQTPYRYFPVEPHWLFPWFQHLPVTTRAMISRHWPLVHSPTTNQRTALNAVLEVELLSRTEMQVYFPESRILAERVGPLVKSLIAVRT
jgi:hypothetical protein